MKQASRIIACLLWTCLGFFPIVEPSLCRCFFCCHELTTCLGFLPIVEPSLQVLLLLSWADWTECEPVQMIFYQNSSSSSMVAPSTQILPHPPWLHGDQCKWPSMRILSPPWLHSLHESVDAIFVFKQSMIGGSLLGNYLGGASLGAGYGEILKIESSSTDVQGT